MARTRDGKVTNIRKMKKKEIAKSSDKEISEQQTTSNKQFKKTIYKN
ncbi:15954_t:CDS:2, partial [Gigaspora margarita]